MYTLFSVVDVVDVSSKEVFRSLPRRVVVAAVVAGGGGDGRSLVVVHQLVWCRVVVEHDAAHKVAGRHLDVLREQRVGVGLTRLEAHLHHSFLRRPASSRSIRLTESGFSSTVKRVLDSVKKSIRFTSLQPGSLKPALYDVTVVCSSWMTLFSAKRSFDLLP